MRWIMRNSYPYYKVWLNSQQFQEDLKLLQYQCKNKSMNHEKKNRKKTIINY